MEKSTKEIEKRRVYVTNKIEKLTAKIAALEDRLANNGNKFHDDFFSVAPLAPKKGDEILPEKSRPPDFSKLLEVTAKCSGFKLEGVSRRLQYNPGRLYLYDSLIEGYTAALKFIVKFVETVQGPGDECGEISAMEAEVIMSKGDPETLSDWISECCNKGDFTMLMHGLVDFTDLANNRRSILRTLFKRGKSGHLGSSSFLINGEEDGVMVIGVSPKKVNLFSIIWKIKYCHTMKLMKSTFTVELFEDDLQYQSAEVFAALQRPTISEEDLPLLWEAIADTLASCH
ncbi:uncharacterized protein [Hetaerina americana]|uniref:uncharacterized protein n=1 Tax=Hetaerina americana TaxID=62018 RepID=UPI003A7F1329